MLPALRSLISSRTPAAAIAMALAIAAADMVRSDQPSAGGRIRIDFRVVAEDGSPVRDLRADDIRLRVAGRPRAVSSLELFEASRGASSPPPAVPAPFATSGDPGPAPDLLLVVDDASLDGAALSQVRDAIEGLLGAMGALDRVGLRSVRPGGANLAPTIVRDEIRTAAAALTTTVIDGCGVASVIDALTNIVRARGGDAPADVLVFLPPPPDGACAPNAEAMAHLGAASRAAGVRLHVARVGLRASPGPLDALAASTGGDAMPLAADDGAAAGRVVRATSAYYVASVEIAADERDGSMRPLVVEVNRPGVRVLARSTVGMPPGGRPVPALSPRDMVRAPMPYREFPIRAAAYPSSNYDGRVKLVVLYEPSNDEGRIAAASLALFDMSGRLIAQSTAPADDLARRPAVAAFVVAPGRYRLRVAATDGARRGGTVDALVDAHLTSAGPVTLSGLLLGGPDVMALSPRLLFTAEPTAAAYLEVYDVRPGATLGVRFELATDPRSPALQSIQAMLPPSTTSGRIATAALPIAALGPGDYLVRAIVTLDGQPAGEAIQTLRKR